MIRRFEIKDIDKLMEIWLITNIKAHDFIDENYWKNNFNMVKEMFPQAEIYLYGEGEEILGFAGLMENYIAGIFVLENFQSKGVGKSLLDYVKKIKSQLTLQVYEKNIRAVKFYERENFKIQLEQIDENINEKEFVMSWKK